MAALLKNSTPIWVAILKDAITSEYFPCPHRALHWLFLSR